MLPYTNNPQHRAANHSFARGNNRYVRYWPDNVREKVLEARRWEVDAWARDRQIPASLIQEVAGTALRLGRIPELGGLGLSYDDSEALAHFIKDTFLNMEDADCENDLEESRGRIRRLPASGRQLRGIRSKKAEYSAGIRKQYLAKRETEAPEFAKLAKMGKKLIGKLKKLDLPGKKTRTRDNLVHFFEDALKDDPDDASITVYTLNLRIKEAEELVSEFGGSGGGKQKYGSGFEKWDKLDGKEGSWLTGGKSGQRFFRTKDGEILGAPKEFVARAEDCESDLEESTKPVVGQSWSFKKTGSASKFKDIVASIIKRGDRDWSVRLNKSGLKVAVENQDPISQQDLNKLANLARAHHGNSEKTIYESLGEGRGPSDPRVPLKDKVAKRAEYWHDDRGVISKYDYDRVMRLLKKGKNKDAIMALQQAFQGNPKWTKKNLPHDVVALERSEYFGEAVNFKGAAKVLLKKATDAKRPIGYTGYLRAVIQGNGEQATHMRTSKTYKDDATQAMQDLIDMAGKAKFEDVDSDEGLEEGKMNTKQALTKLKKDRVLSTAMLKPLGMSMEVFLRYSQKEMSKAQDDRFIDAVIDRVEKRLGEGIYEAKTKNVKLGYDTYKIFQQYWEGQGDPLYAILSRRGGSVDIVTIAASREELQRLKEVAKEILSGDDATHKRVAKATLKRMKSDLTEDTRKGSYTSRTTKKAFPFARKKAHYAKAEDESLHYAYKDANEAMKAADRLGDEIASGYYQDEIHTVAAEMKKRGLKPRKLKENYEMPIKEWSTEAVESAYVEQFNNLIYGAHGRPDPLLDRASLPESEEGHLKLTKPNYGVRLNVEYAQHHGDPIRFEAPGTESVTENFEYPLMEVKSGTVDTFLTIASGGLTQYAQKQPNPYALGHYLGALQKARKRLKAYLNRDDKKALDRMIAVLKTEFIYERNRFSLSPLNRVVKQVAAWTEKGKHPKYPGSSKRRKKKVTEGEDVLPSAIPCKNHADMLRINTIVENIDRLS